MAYRFYGKRSRLPARIWWLLLGLIVAVTIGIFITWHVYNNGLKPVSTSQKNQIINIKSGSTVKQIADKLQDEKLIRSSWALQLYVHRKNLGEKLQAGTYAFSPDQGTEDIVRIMTKGRVSKSLVTILPGQRIDQVRASFINEGFSPSDVNQALDNLGQYSDLPVMAFKPTNVNTLEGLLWPDSWFKDPTTSATQIVRQSLTEMGQHLTPDIQAAFAAQGLTTYQGITLASIIIQEVNKPGDQALASQVFLSRLHSGSVLGSDVTVRYGAIAAGLAPNLRYDSPYNTHLHQGLPPTPISSINESSLNAAAHPASTNWLYFVTGDDGNTYFSTNLKDHEALTAKYCHKLCSQ